jgi:hypothetical protein
MINSPCYIGTQNKTFWQELIVNYAARWATEVGNQRTKYGICSYCSTTYSVRKRRCRHNFKFSIKKSRGILYRSRWKFVLEVKASSWNLLAMILSPLTCVHRDASRRLPHVTSSAQAINYLRKERRSKQIPVPTPNATLSLARAGRGKRLPRLP